MKIVSSTVQVNLEFARKVLNIVDQGLTEGMNDAGKPVKPGNVCVEAAVAMAAGEPHTDHPACVNHRLADLKIQLNDDPNWNNKKSRARGLRRLAIAQLGSNTPTFMMNEFWVQVTALLAEQMRKGIINQLQQTKTPEKFFHLVADINKSAPKRVISLQQTLEGLAWASGRWQDEQMLCEVAELFVQALIKMKIKGTKYLYITEGKATRKAIKAKMRRQAKHR